MSRKAPKRPAPIAPPAPVCCQVRTFELLPQADGVHMRLTLHKGVVMEYVLDPEQVLSVSRDLVYSANLHKAGVHFTPEGKAV